MRSVSLLILMILLISVILMTGCTSSTEAPAATPVPTIDPTVLASMSGNILTPQPPPTPSVIQPISTEATEANQIAQAIDYLNTDVHNFALQQVQHSSQGYYNIAQICDVWQTMNNQWTYVSDPPNFDYWTSASDSIVNGLKGNCADYATLNAAVIESIGGSSRVITACAPGGTLCHAYAEVYLGNSESAVQTASKYICSRYNCGSGGGINYHTITDAQGNMEYWLNLDWQPNNLGGHNPGGPFFQDDGTYHVFYPDIGYSDATCSNGNTCTITGETNENVLLQQPLVAPTIIVPTPTSALFYIPTTAPVVYEIPTISAPTPIPTLNYALRLAQTPIPAITLASIYPITIVNNIVNIPYNINEEYSFNGNSGNVYHISVGASSLINILVMDQTNYNIYQNAFKSGSAVTFTSVSYKSVRSQDFDYILPNSGTYYVVIDNSPFLTGSANSKTSVMASTKILLTGH